jgi:diguanylate cyclase (GGDEF)-like protein
MGRFAIIPTDDPRQAHRMRRFLMAVAASGMVLALVGVAWLLEMVERRVFLNTGAAILVVIAVFFVAFRSGVNRRFADPSLTLLQVLAATVVVLYLLYAAPESRGVFSLLYSVIFFFGIFRLSTRELLGVALFASAVFGLIVLSEWYSGAPHLNLKRDFLRWIVLSSALVYLSVMAGYIGRLRKQASENRAQLVTALETIKDMAARDDLTGVLNRRSLVTALRSEQERAERYGTTFSVCVMDLDFFKRVNDSHGHSAGDAVLKKFAASASSCLRPTDTVGRYGGEEFVLLLPQTPIAGALVVAERIRARCGELTFDALTELHITVSIGVAEHAQGESWEGTIERADHALYRAKQNGRDCVRTAAPPGAQVQA